MRQDRVESVDLRVSNARGQLFEDPGEVMKTGESSTARGCEVGVLRIPPSNDLTAFRSSSTLATGETDAI